MAYPTAIGCGCLLGAGGLSHVLAAEWSVQPILSMESDYDSDRNLQVGTGGSEAATLYTDLRLQRSVESMQILLEPRFDVRRYSASIWGPGNDRSLTGNFTWASERTKVSLMGFIGNQTTLTTEPTETGIINGSIRRRSSQASGEWDWSHSELHQSFVQATYTGAAYSGGQPQLLALELPGYHFSSGAIGERFFPAEKWTLSVSAFGDALSSTRPGSSSHEEGGQVEANYRYTERMAFDVSIGESKRSLAGQTGTGTDASVSVTETLERGSAALAYVRSLVPYGIGYLVQRQQFTASLVRPVAPTLDWNLTVLRIQNNASTVRLGLDRPSYLNTQVGLNWHIGESWSLLPTAGTSWSRPITPPVLAQTGFREPTVFEWRAALTLVWQPLPAARSR